MNGQEFLKYANEAGNKIKKINQLVSGTTFPEEGSLLGEVARCIYFMVQIYLAPIVWKEIDSDELCNMTTQIMFADEDEIDKIIQEVIDSAHER